MYFCCAKVSMYSYKVNALDLCLVRTTVVGVWNILQILHASIPITVPSDMLGVMLVRNIAGLVGFTALVYALKYLPMAMFMILNNTGPFIASLMAFFFLKERLMKHEVIAMLLSFGCVLVIAMSKP